jgi:hypothetical protein
MVEATRRTTKKGLLVTFCPYLGHNILEPLSKHPL